MPAIAFSTSRDPARKTRSFIRDIINVIPQASRITRGTARLDYILHMAKSKGYHTAVIIHSVKGNPNFFRIFDLTGAEIRELPWAIKLYGYSLEREYQKEKRKKSQPSALTLISTLSNPSEEALLKRIFNATERKITRINERNFVTAYADYLDEEKGLIFVEFLDGEGTAVGPRLKLRIIPRRVGRTIYEKPEVEDEDDRKFVSHTQDENS